MKFCQAHMKLHMVVLLLFLYDLPLPKKLSQSSNFVQALILRVEYLLRTEQRLEYVNKASEQF